MSSFENKMRAVYDHGRMDYIAGGDFNSSAVREVYSGLNEVQKKILEWAWQDGWLDERFKNSLPEGTPA